MRLGCHQVSLLPSIVPLFSFLFYFSLLCLFFYISYLFLAHTFVDFNNRKVRETFPEMVIIGNGDAHSFTEANQMISKTSVDAAMSGYANIEGR